jgi:IS30 family transposase
MSYLGSNPALLAVVGERLEEDWSPEQIAVRLKRVHSDAASMRVLHETIYRTIGPGVVMPYDVPRQQTTSPESELSRLST